jgi:hypothetical protein
MMNKIILVALALTVLSSGANAQRTRNAQTTNTWYIGHPQASSMVARLSGTTLTITGTGEMKDFPPYTKDETPPAWTMLVTNIVIKEGVTSIGKYAFKGADELQSVSLPETLTHIGEAAFSESKNLQTIVIPDGVTNIGRMAFSSARSLKSVSIGKNLANIGELAFYNSDRIVLVINRSLVPQTIDGSTFNAFLNRIKLYVPQEAIELYKSANIWSHFRAIEAIEE